MARNFNLTWSFETANPLSLYSAFDRNDIEWDDPTFNEAALPGSTGNSLTPVTVTDDAGMNTALGAGRRYITVPTGTTLGAFDVSTGNDIEIELQGTAKVGKFTFGRHGTPPSRIRVRGGIVGALDIINSSDMVFDGVKFSPDLAGRTEETVVFLYQNSRFAWLNSIFLAYQNASNEHGNPFYVDQGNNNILVANCNLAARPRNLTTGGSKNTWNFRFHCGNSQSHDRVLLIDCTGQAFQNPCVRHSSEDNSTERRFQLHRCKWINTYECNNVWHSQDNNPIQTDELFAVLSTFIFSDQGGVGAQSLIDFGGSPSRSGSGGRDKYVRALECTYIARTTGILSADGSNFDTIRAAGLALGTPVSDLNYKGTRANRDATNGATITIDSAINSKWPSDNTAANWPTIVSPLTGQTIGSNPWGLL